MANMYAASRAPAPSLVTLPATSHPPEAVIDFLDRRFPHVGREVWRSRMSAGRVTFDDGEVVTDESPYRPGVRVRYYREVPREPKVPFVEEILYLDEHLLVVDKPHFLPVTPGGPYVNECLLYRLREKTGLSELIPIHRLDRDTAGLVLFAVSRQARGAYGRLFMAGEVEKEYRALARLDHEPEESNWTVKNRIVRGDPWFRMTTVEGPANASTRIELLERGAGVGLFRLRPGTGKKHQLRVHLAGLGFPIVGDRYYPNLRPESAPDFSRPLCLLARELRLRDPFGGRLFIFQSRCQLPQFDASSSASSTPLFSSNWPVDR